MRVTIRSKEVRYTDYLIETDDPGALASAIVCLANGSTNHTLLKASGCGGCHELDVLPAESVPIRND